MVLFAAKQWKWWAWGMISRHKSEMNLMHENKGKEWIFPRLISRELILYRVEQKLTRKFGYSEVDTKESGRHLHKHLTMIIRESKIARKT